MICRIQLWAALFISFSMVSTLGIAQSPEASSFIPKCGGCHGPTGAAPSPVAKSMGVKPAWDPEYKAHTPGQMFASVKNGKGRMPPFNGRLTDAQIREAIAYFRQLGDSATRATSVKPPSEPAAPPTTPAPSAKPKMTNDAVIQLVNAGLSEQVMINAVRKASSSFDLSPTGLVALKSAKVPDAVIAAMQERDAAEETPAEVAAPAPPKPSVSEAATPRPAPPPQDPCSGIEMMGLYKNDMRPAAPLIVYLAKVRNGTSLTRIVTVGWLDLYGQEKVVRGQVGPGDIGTFELGPQQPIERQPINLRVKSCE